MAGRLRRTFHYLGRCSPEPLCRSVFFFFFQAEDGIRDHCVTGVQDVCSSDLRLFLDLAHERLLDALAEMHEAARDAPLALPRRPAAPREQDALPVEHHGAHGHPRRVGKLTRGGFHQITVSARGARPARVQRSVAYFSRSSVAASPASSSDRPPGSSVSPCAVRKPSARELAASSKDGRRPSTVSSVVMSANGSFPPGKTRRRRPGMAPSTMAPCWRKAAPWRRWALPTSLRPSTSSSKEPVRAKQKAGIAAGFEGWTGTIATGAPKARKPVRSPSPIQRYVSRRSAAPSKSPAAAATL